MQIGYPFEWFGIKWSQLILKDEFETLFNVNFLERHAYRASRQEMKIN